MRSLRATVPGLAAAKRRFREIFPRGFADPTRLAKWPVVTLFPFVAQPARHLIVKPRVMKRAAEQLGFDLAYRPQPNATTYATVMRAASLVRDALAPWRPRDLIDVQGFIWVT